MSEPPTMSRTARATHRRARRRRSWPSAPVTLFGVVLIWGGLGFFGYMAAWQHHARQGQTALVRSERAVIATTAARARAAAARSGRAVAPCVEPPAGLGQLAGLLEVPALHLTAPVEEGTDDPELSVAVGHAPASVWPGAAGSSILLAHDVSYFVHLGQLQPGDTLTYRNACQTVDFTVTGQQVVAAGTPVPDSTGPTLVLDTCYPPDALFFTSQRLLVTATETTSSLAGTRLATPAADTPTYSVPAPPALVAQGLTLEQNEAPMGTMTLAGDPSTAWEQSPGPLALEAAALEAYFGALHAAAADRPDWWTAVVPGQAMPAALRAAVVRAHDAPLDVEIDSTAGRADQVVLRTTVGLEGPWPGTYALTVVCPVVAGTVTVGSWQMGRTS